MNTGKCSKCGNDNEYSKIICDFCGVRLPWASVTQTQKVATPTAKPVRSSPVGVALITLGICGALYFAFVFDTTVSAGGYTVNNIGLMQDRQNYLLLSLGAVGLGCFLLYLARKQND